MNLKSPITPHLSIHETDDMQRETEDLLKFGTWIWTPQTGGMEWSDGMHRLMGYSLAGLEGNLKLEDHLQRLQECDRENFQKELHMALKSGHGFRMMHSINGSDGRSFIAVTKAKVLDKDGELRVMGTTQNISDVSRLQEEMILQRRQLDEYEVFLKFGTWSLSAATNEIYWSVGMYHLFGYDVVKDKHLKITEELYLRHVDPLDHEKAEFLKSDSRANKNEYFWQYRIKSATGETKWLETYGHINRDEKGQFIGIFGITRDITRLKLYEHSLESKIKELNRSNSELEEFAYVASHDMQEPLRKLITFSERLTSKFSDVLKDEGRLYLDRMLAATNNMRLLIDNLLDFSRIARTGDAYEKTDMNVVLQKVLADLEVTIEDTQAVINTDTLPVIEAQAAQMKQLLCNIVSNALKFRKPSVPPQINIRSSVLALKQAEDLGLDKNVRYFSIEVKDNGIGFEQEYAQRIFQIFQRLHGKAEYPGSGIGLAICKKIVDYHNGVIHVQGQLDEGAVITIILPEKQ